jgi:hypothetical protein
MSIILARTGPLSPACMFACACMIVAVTGHMPATPYVVDPEYDKFNPDGKPNMNDDFRQSRHMPDELKCDGCILLAYKVSLERICWHSFEFDCLLVVGEFANAPTY